MTLQSDAAQVWASAQRQGIAQEAQQVVLRALGEEGDLPPELHGDAATDVVPAAAFASVDAAARAVVRAADEALSEALAGAQRMRAPSINSLGSSSPTSRSFP